MNQAEYRELGISELELTLFSTFNRYQEVKKCWRKENNSWTLTENEFIEQWKPEHYRYLSRCLKTTIKTGGTVLGAFYDNKLVGFAAIENEPFGSQNEYLQLSNIHISYEYRNIGIGKKLFFLICNIAKKMGAKKLYISSHSSEESQAFYKSIGCIEAIEYNKKISSEEPFDCQLEYNLTP